MLGARHLITHWWSAGPRSLRLVLAAVTTVIGVLLLTRPVTSLEVLAALIGVGLLVHGATEALSRETTDSAETRAWQGFRAAVAALSVGAGVLVLAFPDITLRLLAVVVGAGMLASAARSLAAGILRSGTLDARVADVAFGITGIVFGLLALVWPDVTLLVVAVIFGARLLMAGLALGWQVLRRKAPEPRAASVQPPSVRRRWARTLSSVVVVCLAAGAAVASGLIREGAPTVDGFYAAPAELPAAPGQLIRAERFTREVPEGAQAWRILYSTTRGDGTPAVASGLVVVPTIGAGSWPVIDWAHGTTGYAESCAPSLADEPFESGALMVLPEIIEQGWALVATDYVGLGTAGPHPYLIGNDSAHAVLDAVRAARQLTEADLGQQTVLWGHSQGGGAALWAGAVADSYAPDVPLDGVAALAPASNLRGLVAGINSVTGGSIFASYVIAAYSATYDDVMLRDYVRPGAALNMRAMADRCLASPEILASALTALVVVRDPVFADAPAAGPLGARLAENEPPAGARAPLLIGQGDADGLVTPTAQQEYVDRLCAAGQTIDHRSYAGLDHLSLVANGSVSMTEVFAWTRDRLAGTPTTADHAHCRRSAHTASKHNSQSGG